MMTPKQQQLVGEIHTALYHAKYLLGCFDDINEDDEATIDLGFEALGNLADDLSSRTCDRPETGCRA